MLYEACNPPRGWQQGGGGTLAVCCVYQVALTHYRLGVSAEIFRPVSTWIRALHTPLELPSTLRYGGGCARVARGSGSEYRVRKPPGGTHAWSPLLSEVVGRPPAWPVAPIETPKFRAH